MKAFFILGFLLIICAHASATREVYTTQRGQVFKKVPNDSFGVAWMAPDGSVWSQYQGTFSNQGTLASDTGVSVILKSESTEVCANIGGELPSIEQFRTLAKYFEDTTEFQILFPFPESQNLFWTRDGIPGFARFAKLSPILDPFGDLTSETKKLAVMCIH